MERGLSGLGRRRPVARCVRVSLASCVEQAADRPARSMESYLHRVLGCATLARSVARAQPLDVAYLDDVSGTPSAPDVPMRPIARGKSVGGLEVLSRVVADRQHDGERDVVGNVEELRDLLFVNQRKRRPRGTDAPYPQREHEGPGGGEDGTVRRGLRGERLLL